MEDLQNPLNASLYGKAALQADEEQVYLKTPGAARNLDNVKRFHSHA